ncbi:formyl transferase [Apiospora arundinis]
MSRTMTISRPLAVVSSVLPCATKAWQSPAIATASCRLWWLYCGSSSPRGFTTTARRSQEQQRKKKESDALRILFCGSDEFSSASLRALHEEKERNPGLIESIDVVVRPGKPVGRGMKSIRHPPIRDVAEKLGLPIHERDTFTQWDMPSAINLIIAVSFGKLVPNRLLAAAKYGGLNVHPSLLPDLRGPAPLHHALLRQMNATGVSLQTLDPHEFDKGLVLAQSRDDALIQIPPQCTVPQLLELVTPVGADMLVQGLRDGVHVPPLEEQRSGVAKGRQAAAAAAVTHAPKIETKDRDLFGNFTHPSNAVIDKVSGKGPWGGLPPPHSLSSVGPVESVALAQRVIGPLWFRAMDCKSNIIKRVIIDKADTEIVFKAPPKGLLGDVPSSSEMTFDSTCIFGLDDKEGSLANTSQLWYLLEDGDDSIYLFDGPYSDESRRNRRLRCLRISSLKVDGQAAKPARHAIDHFYSFLGVPK